MELFDNSLNTLFDNSDSPILILKNNSIKYMNSMALKALNVPTQHCYQQDFFKFCLSMHIELNPPIESLKNGELFFSKSNNTITTLWHAQTLSNETFQNKLLLLSGSESTKTDNSLPNDSYNHVDIDSLEEFTKKIMGSAAKKYNSPKEYIKNLYLYLDSIIYNMPGSVYWKDVNGVYLGCNEGALEVVGLSSKEELIGKTDYDMAKMHNWPEGAVDSVINLDKRIIETKQPIRNIEEGPYKTGDKFILYLSNKIPLFDQNHNVVGLLGISTDITALKEAQQRERTALAESVEANAKVQAQEEIQKALLTFTGTMSHDLRTPLSSIQVNTIFLEKTLPILVSAYKQLQELNNEDTPALDPHQISLLEDSYQNILNATIQAESYIDTTLKILKGAATGSELLKPNDLAPCSIEEVLRRVLRSYPFKEGESNKLHSDTLDGFMFMGNSIFMARVLQNLIKNAFEQIHLKGRGEIFIHCEEGKSLNYLNIKDTAGGVTPSLLKHLFDGFNSTKAKGTGLGLSSAKQIMKAFGGDISCYLVNKDFIEFKLSFPKID